MADLKNFAKLGKKILGVGRNYKSLLNQRGFTPYDEPVIFFKLPTSYIQEGQKFKIPSDSDELFHEVELGVIIGKKGSSVKEEVAMEFVGGYTVALDMTDATSIKKAAKIGSPWALGKGFDTSCPVGKFVPKESILDPHNLRLWCKVNGELRQDNNTSDLYFRIPKLISYISQRVTLEPGDLILTGTPGGVDVVKPGDTMVAGIEGLGEITFDCEAWN